MPKIYISPSTQEHNLYAGGGTEEQYMNKVADILVPKLQNKYGFTIFRNSPTMTLSQVIADSNIKKPDIHVAIHSNAGGARGCEVFAYFVSGKTTNSQKLAWELYNELAPVTPTSDRGVKQGNHLGEVRSTNATAALIEVDFHDSAEGAKWITANLEVISNAIEKGICKYFNVAYKVDVVPESPKADGKLYRVQVGAFGVKANAEKLMNELKSKGYNAFIREE